MTTEEKATQQKNIFDSKVLGHPAGLFVLFFTEMWERFSFYGMRVLLINFLTIAAIGSNPGWEWTSGNAGALFGTYAGLLYLTPILGGVIADKITGYRWAVLIGCIIMTLGHAAMALETEFSLYLGLALLVIGTGFFKPNITSIISEMYVYLPEKKDSAYTLFYMGVNSGAFFGMMLCGYLAERIGWSWGFGLAGIFMLFGTLQFLLAKPLFGHIGESPRKLKRLGIKTAAEIEEEEIEERRLEEEKKTGISSQKEITEAKFTLLDKILIVVTSIIGLLYLIDDPVSKITASKGSEINLLPKEFLLDPETLSGPLVILIIGLILFLYLVISRISRYSKIVRDRMIAVIIFAFFTVLFFIPFEQAATSMVMFARDFTERVMTGTAATIFNIANSLLTIIPLLIITWVLILLYKNSFKKIPGSNIVLILCFTVMWGMVIWMLNRDFSTTAYDITYDAAEIHKPDLDKEKAQNLFDIPIVNYKVEYDTIKNNQQSWKQVLAPLQLDSNQYNIITDDLVEGVAVQENKIVATLTEEKEEKPSYLIYEDDKQNYITFSLVDNQLETNKVDMALIDRAIQYEALTEARTLQKNEKKVKHTLSISTNNDLAIGDPVKAHQELGKFIYLEESKANSLANDYKNVNQKSQIIQGEVKEVKDNEVEITTSWFSILNSFFIIAFASIFSKWWESKYNPSAAVKYGLGLIVMAIGFAILAYGSRIIPAGAEAGVVKVGMIWLILAYLFHTLGELCLSPVGLSYVSKLVPGKMIALMFGMWYLAIAIGNKVAASMGGMMDKVQENPEFSLSGFFWIFAIVPFLAGILVILLNPLLKKLMHGVR